MTSLPNKSLKLKHSDLPDDFFEPDIEHYATWLGTSSLQKWVVSHEISTKVRLLGRVRDKNREYTTQADLTSGKLSDSTCSCGKGRCPHVALLMMVYAAQQRAEQEALSTLQQKQVRAEFEAETQRVKAMLAQTSPTGQTGRQGQHHKKQGRQDNQRQNNRNQPQQSAQPAATPPASSLPPRSRGWLNQMEQALGNKANHNGQTLAYVLSQTRHRGQPTLYARVYRAEWESEGLHLAHTFKLPYTLRYDPDSIRDLPQYARRDLATLRLLATSAQSAVIEGEECYLLGDSGLGNLLLSSMLDTGRLVWKGHNTPLQAGEVLSAQMTWHTDNEGMQRLLYQAPEGVVKLPVSPAWYLKDERVLGRLQSALSSSAEEILRNLPPVSPEESAALGEAVQKMFGEVVPPPTPITVRQEELPYRPLLRLSYRAPELRRKNSWGTPRSDSRPMAELLHLYGDQTPPPVGQKLDTHQSRHYENGEVVIISRDIAAERKAASQVTRMGFQKLSKLLPPTQKLGVSEHPHWLALETDEQWYDFIERGMGQLEAKGIRVEMPEDFPYRLAYIEDWYGETEEKGGWFTLDLGVVVDGQKVSLLPILVSLIASRPELFSAEALAALSDDEILYAALPDGRKLPLPAGRVRNIIGVLVELNLRDLPDGPLTLPLLDAARLSQLEEALRARWVGAERLLELGRKLRGFAGIQEVPKPAGLNADLRPYQQQGLNWLQFLRETEMGGILADDMGLGKTVQTLAHIQTEKEAGRATLPSMVIAPTSVLSNWKREAGRFTPNLKVLTLHGAERKKHFAEMSNYDLVLTTYPLLPRDLSELEKQNYHFLILDEAQNIKNAKSASAKAAGGLTANHRLALTGTPLENHLGELWSLFNFLSPGLLHNEKMFRELYRTPIEKHGDAARRMALASRIRPFVLRREKGEVARELPPKTEIPVRVSLEGDQRDLYETVRVTMQERVREELRARGLARSTIAILDALLKLRQAVTDPRLVKLEAAHNVKHNAKLDWFTENVPKLVEEGRRILVFSAFATLLGHLEERLKAMGIPYSKLTGQTKLREPQIAAFQNGETHVFLISLKAGGVGLNLTAADTVIHYDPWWNPAAENQATDRAYRIGQDKPVFVYKLLAAGSVEERILEMQERKAALAKGVLDGGLSDASQLTQRDLDKLFAPLEDAEEEEE